MKKASGEQTTYSNQMISQNRAIRDAYMRILPSLGDLWHRHAALGVKTETLARLLYIR